MSLEALGLDDTATQADVIARYKELAKQAHPDAGGTVEKFQELKMLKDDALKELAFGTSIARARIQLSALREAARGTKCPRCDGTGVGTTRSAGFRTFSTVCRLCRGKKIL